MERLHTPLPLISHLGESDGFNSSLKQGPVEIVFVDPGGIQQATHVVDLVCTPLEGADSTADEDPKKVVRAKFVLQEILQNILYKLEFGEGIGWIVLEVQLR